MTGEVVGLPPCLLTLCPLCQETMWRVRSYLVDHTQMTHELVCTNKDCLRFELVTLVQFPVLLHTSKVEVRL